MDRSGAGGRVVGVLSPFVGGTYYGSLIAGISAAAERRGARTIAIQALDAAAELTITGGNPAFTEPVAWRRADGFLVLAALPNRASFLTTLTAAAERSAPFTVLFLDLDGFKRVNDTLGHAAGDELLVHVARRIRANLRPTDVPARFGGIIARLTAAISAPYNLTAGTARIGVSIGATTNSGGHTAEQLLHDADAAMYRAKAASG